MYGNYTRWHVHEHIKKYEKIKEKGVKYLQNIFLYASIEESYIF